MMLATTRHGDTVTNTGTPIGYVLLHGVGSDSRSWNQLAPLLDAPSLAIDLPGHGGSPWRDDADYSPAAVAPDVVATIRAHVTAPVVLVGHSLGAMVAARVTTLAADLVTALVLVDMTPDFADRALDGVVRGLVEEPAFDGADAYVAHAARVRPGEPETLFRDEARHAFTTDPDGRLHRVHHFTHVADGLTATLGRFSDLWPDLDRAAVPVLLVRGDRGYVSPKLARAFEDRVTGATVATIASRHGVHTQAPAELADTITTWVHHTGDTERHRNDTPPRAEPPAR
jgi:pimeloyl-ACP methyl ester carboxylesterase